MSEDELGRMEKVVQDLVEIMYGKNGKDGFISKVNSHEEWIKNKDKDFYGTFNFVYRAVIGAILTYIAWKVGLKP